MLISDALAIKYPALVGLGKYYIWSIITEKRLNSVESKELLSRRQTVSSFSDDGDQLKHAHSFRIRIFVLQIQPLEFIYRDA